PRSTRPLPRLTPARNRLGSARRARSRAVSPRASTPVGSGDQRVHGVVGAELHRVAPGLRPDTPGDQILEPQTDAERARGMTYPVGAALRAERSAGGEAGL